MYSTRRHKRTGHGSQREPSNNAEMLAIIVLIDGLSKWSSAVFVEHRGAFLILPTLDGDCTHGGMVLEIL